MRRIILHIGANKTGSSALQCGFARYRRELREAGVFYPGHPGIERSASGGFSSGNADDIRAFLIARFRPPDFSEDAFFAELRRRLDAGSVPTILFSNEGLHNADPERLQILRDFLKGHCDHIDIYYYVRNFLDHAYSCYVQDVKMGRESGRLDTFLSRYRPPFLRNCLKYRQVFGASGLHVEVYEHHVSNLFLSFLTWIGCPTSGMAGVELVNRSLTSDEVTVLRALNSVPMPSRMRSRLAIALADEDHGGRCPTYVDPQAFSRFQQRHADELEELQWEFLPTSRIHMKSKAIQLGRCDESSWTARAYVLLELLKTLARELPKARTPRDGRA